MKPLKDEKIELRLTGDEKIVIEAKAKKAGVSVSEYMRQVALGIEITQVLTEEQHRTIVGVANNLNQLTRFAHKGKVNISRINQILEELTKALK